MMDFLLPFTQWLALIIWIPIFLISFAIAGRGNRLLWCGLLPVVLFFTEAVPLYCLNYWSMSYPGEIFITAFIFCLLVTFAPSTLLILPHLLNVWRSKSKGFSVIAPR
jgi:hypothetical protein